ncbi:MAG: histidine phosphatase family protein [Candidatus Eremiobacteraeota bacterium]|nr:histidine phosphatase family protein [Candidatus Eremiobacteraeota bacterium]MBV9698521.1 histidine phosphatase family protein [Candidatus Eremiobacteraeota bacterium]
MGRIVLCRHGATENNALGQFLSFSDPPLSRAGRMQCERLREDLRRSAFARCYVSPMRRCLQTREIAAPDVPFTIEDALREVSFGDWEGKTMNWLESHVPDQVADRRRDPVTFRPPGGESFEDVARRLEPLLDALRSNRAALVVGHRGTLSVLERLLRGMPLSSKAVGSLEPAEFHVIETLR